jgi:hypothetical protein
MSTQKVESTRCAKCQAPSKIVVWQLIDAQDLALKSAFLQKRVHSVPCPQCGATLVPSVPTLYYDGEQQLALIFAPTDLHLRESTQERVIAELSEALRAKLSAEQPAATLPQPRRCASLDAMVDAILEADGLDPQALQVQAAKARLIETLLQASSEAELREQAMAHADELDAECFEIMTAYMHAAQMRGDTAGAQAFLTLRTLLGQWLPQGARLIAAIDTKLGVSAIQSRAELFERLRDAPSDSERAELVARAHFLIDQQFFALINSAINQAVSIGDSASVRQLKRLSARVAELKREQQARGLAEMQRASALLQAVVQADAPEQVLQQRLADIDETFFVVLGAHIERARRQGQSEPARALEMLGQLARALQQEQVAP